MKCTQWSRRTNASYDDAMIRTARIAALPLALLAFGAPLAAYAATPTRDKLSDSAANYPSKPVRFIVPYSPGAGTDTTARTIAAKLAEKWGQQVVIDNRPGASGVIAVEQTALANPDGHTICLFSASQATIESTGQKLPYDITKDLQPVTQVTSVFFVVYHPPSLPVKSIRELIAYAKANPGKINYGTSGIGSLQHFAGELMSHTAGIRMVQVPYKGAANIVTAMLANEVQLGFNSMFSVRPQVQAGRLRWLAITAGKRSPTVDLPTVAESGLPGYDVVQWYGIITSARVPAPIVKNCTPPSPNRSSRPTSCSASPPTVRRSSEARRKSSPRTSSPKSPSGRSS